MKKAIRYPDSFRFDSDLEVFKKAVDITKQLLEEKRLLIVYGFVKEMEYKLLLTEDSYIEQYGELDWDIYNDILYSEILVILEQNYNEPIEIEEDLKIYLQDEGISEEEISEICNIKLEKRKYVFDSLYTQINKNRYMLKKQTVSRKLSRIKFDISKTVDPEGEILYANIRLKSDYSLPDVGLPKELWNMMNSHHSEEVSFVCDREDIEYLISELRDLQEML